MYIIIPIGQICINLWSHSTTFNQVQGSGINISANVKIRFGMLEGKNLRFKEGLLLENQNSSLQSPALRSAQLTGVLDSLSQGAGWFAICLWER